MAHPDAVRLIEYCVTRAKKELWKFGAFEPFAARIGRNGELSPVRLPVSESKTAPHAVIDDYGAALKTEAGTNATAVALCWVDKIDPESQGQDTPADAIRLTVEHRQSDSVEVKVPFRKTWWLGYAFGEMIGTRRARQFYSGNSMAV